MTEYDYLNARVRGMSTAFLGRGLFDEMLATEDRQLLIDMLLNTAYGPELRSALAVRPGLAAVEAAARRRLHATVASLRSAARGEPLRLLDVQICLWDTTNVLALVRGIVTGARTAEILEAVLPVGDLGEAQLAELASQPDLQSLADTLATWGFAFGHGLRRLVRVGSTPADLATLELALSKAYFDWAFATLTGDNPGTALALRLLRMQVDLENVKAALDRVRHRELGKKIDGFEILSGGLLPDRAIRRAAAQESLVGALEELDETYFAPAVERGILAYGGAGSLGVMERFLEMVVIETGCRLFRTDPLGPGVALGFVWRVYNEFVNLRIVLRGKSYGVPPNIVRQELLLA
jgi:vacuolar-type H+-ATPase subunit C/Vma6